MMVGQTPAQLYILENKKCKQLPIVITKAKLGDIQR